MTENDNELKLKRLVIWNHYKWCLFDKFKISYGKFIKNLLNIYILIYLSLLICYRPRLFKSLSLEDVKHLIHIMEIEENWEVFNLMPFAWITSLTRTLILMVSSTSELRPMELLQKLLTSIYPNSWKFKTVVIQIQEDMISSSTKLYVKELNSHGMKHLHSIMLRVFWVFFAISIKKCSCLEKMIKSTLTWF